MASEMAAWAETGRSPERRTSSRPVDLVHLSRYTLGERALEREVLQLFCVQSTIYLDRLREAQSDKDWREAAHSLKGSARAIGAWRAAAAAERAEGLGAEALPGDTAIRAQRIGEIESSLREAEAYITDLLKDR
jgi:HPt (histidine-containing phosphotransfer) domain-containing protein